MSDCSFCLKIVSFYLIYRAVIVTGLTRPYDLLYRRLRRSEERLSAVLDQLPVGVALLNSDGDILVSNSIFRGYVADKIPSQNQQDREHWKALDEEGNEIPPQSWPGARALRGEETSAGMEFSYTLGDGPNSWVLVSGVPFRTTEGQILGAIVVLQDVTDRKRAEEALREAREHLENRVAERTAELRQRADQLARLTSELTLAEQRERRRLAQVLHDHLQQLLVGAKFGLGMLQNRAGEDLQEAIEQVEGLVDESIKASRSLTVELSPPILHEAGLAEGLEWLARRMEEKHGLVVKLDIDPQAATDREDVRVLLYQSIRELLFNAVKHAGVPEASVSLRLHDSTHIQAVVEDKGRGFNAEAAFDLNDESESTGFGLFSIRERLAMLQGSLEVISRPGHGSRFTLLAPRYQPGSEPEESMEAPSETPAERPEETAASHANGKIRLLLADDHAVVRRGVSMVLSEAEDMTVVGEASDGEEAIQMALRLHPDVVLMDFSMPKMDGVEATRRLKEILPTIRVVGLSMYEEADRAQAMRSAGAAAFLTKGAKADKLIRTIRRVCLSEPMEK
ncbi:MAG: response regulator [Phycisphaerae bacterium]